MVMCPNKKSGRSLFITSLGFAGLVAAGCPTASQAEADVGVGQTIKSVSVPVAEGLGKGFRFLQGLVDNAMHPVFAEFHNKVSLGKTKEALAIYEANRKLLLERKEAGADVAVLLTAARSENGAELEQASTLLSQNIDSRKYLADPIGFSKELRALEGLRDDYVKIRLLADNASMDRVLLNVNAEVVKAHRVVAEHASEIYAAFPHEEGQFSKVYTRVGSESGLFKQSMESILLRLGQKPRDIVKSYFENTAPAWRDDDSLRHRLASFFLEKFGSNHGPLGKLHVLADLESVGFKRTDAETAPSIYFINLTTGSASSNSSNGAAVQTSFTDQGDAALGLPELKEKFLASTSGSMVALILDEALVSRKIINKNEVSSTAIVGQRSVPNPQYELAKLNCFRAQSDLNAHLAKTAMQPPASVAVAILNGITEGLQRATVDKTCKQFAATAAFLSEDIVEPYTFTVMDVQISKTARGRIISAILAKQHVELFPFEKNESRTYRVAYGRKDTDQGSTLGLSTDQELESAASSSLVLAPMDLLLHADSVPPQLIGPAQYNAAFSTNTDLGTSPAIRSSDSKVIVAEQRVHGRRGDAQTVSDKLAPLLPEAGPSAGDSNQDLRMNSVVVIVNPRGSLGTGFYVDSNNILTNFHVIDGATVLELKSFGGDNFTGHVVRKDIGTDLALLHTDRVGVPLKFTDSLVRVGDSVEAIGHPKGLTFSLTRGVVSAVRQMKGALALGGDKAMLIQTDTPINPGNSGGPLLSGSRVIGVNTLKWKSTEGVGFAIHYSEVIRFLSQN